MNTKSTSKIPDKIPGAIMKEALQWCQDFNKSKNNSYETFCEKIMAFLSCYPL